MATSVRSRPIPDGWRTWKGPGGLKIHYPPDWIATPYTGAPAPVAFPLVYLSDHHLGGPCPRGDHGPTDRSGGTSCFDGSWTVPADSVIVRWALIEIPGRTEFAIQAGRHVVIDHRAAKIDTDASCNGSAGSTVTAAVKQTTDPQNYEYYAMQACIGAAVSPSRRSAIYTMLATIRIR